MAMSCRCCCERKRGDRFAIKPVWCVDKRAGATMSDQVMTDQVSSQTPIVDVDLHLDERAADLAPHCEMPWRRILEEPGGQPP